MGTRSLTVFQDEDGTEIVVLYRQYDGYPSGHGKELCEFLAPFEMTQGLHAQGTTANGMGCLAAQVIAHFKTAAGGFYLYPAKTRGADEEYIYTVKLVEGKLKLVITTDAGKQIYKGAPDVAAMAKKLKLTIETNEPLNWVTTRP